MSAPIRGGSEVLVDTTTDLCQVLPTLTALADGRIVVGRENSDEVDPADARAQIFDPRLTPVQIDWAARGDDFAGTPWNDAQDGRNRDDTLRGAGAPTISSLDFVVVAARRRASAAKQEAIRGPPGVTRGRRSA